MPVADTVFPYDDEVRDPYDADDTKNPHEETEGDEAGADEEATGAAPRRRPGRPRKAT
jgi:hypothetical protein